MNVALGSKPAVAALQWFGWGNMAYSASADERAVRPMCMFLNVNEAWRHATGYGQLWPFKKRINSAPYRDHCNC